MKLLIDAQLPVLLEKVLADLGYQTLHVIHLPNGDSITDTEITNYALENDLIVVSKDADFFYSHTLFQKPKKLLLVSTGNTKNKDLLNLFIKNHITINELFKTNVFIEINNNGIVAHD